MDTFSCCSYLLCLLVFCLPALVVEVQVVALVQPVLVVLLEEQGAQALVVELVELELVELVVLLSLVVLSVVGFGLVEWRAGFPVACRSSGLGMLQERNRFSF
jgi:hypothetical protein